MEMSITLENILYLVITTAVPIITTYVIQYLRKLLDKLVKDTQESLVSDTINKASDIIISAVQCTSQTYVDSLKKSGKFNEEAQKKAFNDTKEKVMNLLNEESQRIIGTVYNDVDRWIDIQIEAAIKNNKSRKEGE